MFRVVSKWIYVLLSGVVICATLNPLFAESSSGNVPYLAQITGDQVNLRSGPAQVYYPVTTLDKGQRVKVLKEMFGWAKIEPTKGSFSYIAKEFVDRPAEATTDIFDGTVNADNVRVRAGSIKVPPAHADEVQTKLNSATVVKVIGQRDEYYKILSPQHCYFWVSLKFIKPADPIVAPVVEVVGATPSEKLEEPVNDGQTVEVAVETAETVAEKPAPVLTPRELEQQAYQAIVDAMDAELKKPMVTRDFSPILLQVGELKAQKSSTKKTSLKALERHVKRAELALQIWKRSLEQDEQFKITLAQIDSKIEEAVAIHSPPAKREQDIVVLGRLTNSAVFTANNKNRRFLVPAGEDRITYYAISAKPGVDLAMWVGRDVSLVGRATYDTFSKTRILHVISVVKLPLQLQ